MKKNFTLLIVMLAVFSVTKAQDVYLSGTGFNDAGMLTAVVYRNNEPIIVHSSESMDILGYGVQVNPYNHDEVYSLAILDNSKNLAISNVYRNDDLYVSLGEGSYALKLYWYDSGTDNPEENLYVLGRLRIDGDFYATVWRGNEATPLFSPDAGDGRESMALGVVAVPGPEGTVDLYYGGDREDASHTEKATVWKNNEVLYTFDEPGVDSYVVSMDYAEGDLYFLVFEHWEGGGALKLYVNDQLEYTLIEGTAENYTSCVKVDAGHVYVYAYYDQGMTKVWRDGELLYAHEGTFEEMYDPFCLEVTSDGVYYVSLEFDEASSEGSFYVYHDGTAIQTFDVHELIQLTAIDVVMECADSEARELPYYEGFETGETDWECWTVIDEGENCNEEGVYYNTYWHRQGVNDDVPPVTGDYCAKYSWNDGFTQEGWLISPQIHIPSGAFTQLSFNSYELYDYAMVYEGVWVSVVDDNLGNFTEIWAQTNASERWKTVEIDLSAYQGQDIYIAFKYEGFDGHTWYIDDVGVNVYDALGEQEQAAVAVYPNPARGNIRIEGLRNACEAQIYNSLGELVKTVMVYPDEEIGIGELSDGLYLVRLGDRALRFVKLN